MRPHWEKIAYQLIVRLARLVGSLPPARGLAAGARVGDLLYRLLRRHRTIALSNLRQAYPDQPPRQHEAIARTVFQNLGKIVWEVCWSTTLSNATFSRQITVEGMAHIREAYAQGKGVLVLTAHFGNWEFLTALGQRIGYPMDIVYRPLDFKPLEHFVVGLRTRFGAKMIPKKKGFRKILQSLERRELVALLMDQNVAWREGVFAPFFNRPACTNTGMALMALKTGAPVVPMFMLREKKGYRGIILPALPLVRTGDKTKDVEANTALYNRVIETMVRQAPEQWFWVHRRWNTRPFCPWPRPATDGKAKRR